MLVLGNAVLLFQLLTVAFLLNVFQANPPDPKTFPFILLGNKIDIDGGNSRVVRRHSYCAGQLIYSMIHYTNFQLFRFPRRKQRTGVHQKGTYLTLRHQQKKITMLTLHSFVSPRLLLRMNMSRTCKFILRLTHCLKFSFMLVISGVCKVGQKMTSFCCSEELMH